MKIFITLILAMLPSSVLGQFCSNCIYNQSGLQTGAQFHVASGTVQGQLTVGQLNISTFNVVVGTAAQFYGGGAGLTGLNASALASGNVSSNVVSGPYPDITQVGALTAGQWNASPVPTQYGGTGQNFVDVSAGSLIYFSAAGQMSTFLPGQPQQLLQTNGSGAPVWVSSPAVSGANLYNKIGRAHV